MCSVKGQLTVEKGFQKRTGNHHYNNRQYEIIDFHEIVDGVEFFLSVQDKCSENEDQPQAGKNNNCGADPAGGNLYQGKNNGRQCGDDDPDENVHF